jgi:DNA (cytosine-5)-methyltransferase 1
MKKDIVHLDLFSGAGGFAQGLKQAGFNATKHYFSEIDKHAIANYKHNFKHAEYVGSVTDVRGSQLPERPNIITFGSPCQDFSLAGKRQGMDGERSSLILHAIRLITECKPDLFIWENVKGTFSSNNGADFWAIIQAFANIGSYRIEWQLLNTAWLLPQNRERIYLVGHLGEGSGRNVFPFGEECFKDTEIQGYNPSANCINARYGNDANGSYVGVSKRETLRVISATNSGYETATEGDSINLAQPNSETRRGRVGKGKAQTLETSCNQAVVQPNYKYEAANELVRTNTLTEGKTKGLDFYNKSVRDVIPTLTDPKHHSLGLFDGYRIRRLTEIECERLQGFPDDWTKYGINDKGETINISRTQRYKLMGNAVTVNVVQMIGERLLK